MGKVEIYIKQFDYYKTLAEKAIDQLDDKLLFKDAGDGMNSIAITMKHIAGNQLSRWTNVFEEDGEKEWRNRDDEFIDDFDGKEALMAYWNRGWKVLFDVLNELEEADLEKVVFIRNMGCTVHDAIIRQICHYPYHIGQIVFLAKLFKGKSFTSLSIPLGDSKTYNLTRFEKEKSNKHFTDDIDQIK